MKSLMEEFSKLTSAFTPLFANAVTVYTAVLLGCFTVIASGGEMAKAIIFKFDDVYIYIIQHFFA